MKSYFQNVPLYFTEEGHEYHHKNGQKYISCTQIISQYKEKFDSDKMSRIIAKKRGVSQEEILLEWKKAEKDGTEFGTLIHKNIESYFNTKKCDERILPMVGDLHLKLAYRLEDSYFEQLVWNEKFMICGTADLVNIDGDYFDIFDYKTNKKFNMESKYSNPLMFKYPLENMEINEYNVYSLQLSMYARFVKELTGKIPRDLSVFWYDREDTKDFENFNGQWVEYHLENMETEVNKLFEHYDKKDPILKLILRSKNM